MGAEGVYNYNATGPDKYKVEKMDTKINNTGLICSREPRFKEAPNRNPGPATYTVECNFCIARPGEISTENINRQHVRPPVLAVLLETIENEA